MNNGLIPFRYAKALYKYSLEKGNAEKVYNEMKTIVSSFEHNSELQKTLSNPYLSKDDKKELLLSAAGNEREDDYVGFVKLILESKREEYALQMALAYIDIYRKANNIAKVQIITAAELGKEEMDRLAELVQRSCKDTTLEFTYKVDPKIIGGFVVDVDSVRMDASISNEIEQLRLNLISK